jgi:hypothetical protein
LQAQSSHFQALEKHSYNGLLDGLRKIYAEGGLAGLYHGSRALILRVSCGSAAQLSSYDTTKSLVLAHTGSGMGIGLMLENIGDSWWRALVSRLFLLFFGVGRRS